MYRSGSSSFLDILLGATSFEEFVTNWDVLNQMNKSDAELVQESKDLRAEVEALKVELENQEQVAADKLAEAETIQQEAEATVERLQSLLDSLDAEAKELLEKEQAAAEAARAAEEAERAAAATAAAEAEAAAAANSNDGDGSSDDGGSKKTNSTPTYSGGNGGSSYSGAADYALSKVGCWYAWGATGPNTFDCSGLTQWSYAQAGKSIPRTTESQLAGAKWRGSVSQAQRGDVLYRYGHVAIALGSGGDPYVHAPHTGAKVQVVSGGASGFSYALRF